MPPKTSTDATCAVASDDPDNTAPQGPSDSASRHQRCSCEHSRHRIPATASLPPHLTSRLLRSAEENVLLREQLAAKDKQNADKDKQIAELMAQVSLAKSGHRIIGIWESMDKRRVTEVYEGPQGGAYYLSETGNRMTLNDDSRIEFMSEEDVKKRISSHKAVSADITVVGLHTSVDKKKVRAVFMGPKGGTYILTDKAKTVVKDGDYEPMDKAEVNKRIEAHDAWLASSPTK